MRLPRGLILGVLVLSAAAAAGTGKDYGAPKRFEIEMKAFEESDRKQPPLRGSIVCTGSSTIRSWHDTIEEDLAPLTIIPRGFGGSNMNDLLHHADRVVIRYSPRAVLVYEGDNDIAAGIAPEKVRDTFLAFVSRVRKQLPLTRIYVLSIKPSPSRWKHWPQMQEANTLIAEECSRGKGLTYVDMTRGMFDSSGRVRTDLFLADNLHLNHKGYELWRDTLRPVLLERELKYERQETRG